jgi:prepilin-type processing-associated H-X9-DG protein
MLFESDTGWNAVGGSEMMATHRHYSGLNITLVDGSVEYVEYKDLGKLRWNPYTNAPAK